MTKLQTTNFVPFIGYSKANIDYFLFGAQLKFLALGDVKTMTVPFTSGIVMLLTSHWAYNFNCAPHSSQNLYTIAQLKGHAPSPWTLVHSHFPHQWTMHSLL